jgi:hypothetical protein
MYKEILDKKILSGPIKNPEGKKYSYRYCSTDGSAFILSVGLKATKEQYIQKSMGDGEDNCTPGE